MRVNVLMPSRGRPERCHDACKSALRTASSNVRIHVGIDEDDPELGTYKKVLDGIGSVEIHIIPAETPLPNIFNRLFLVCRPARSIMMIATDDLEWRSDGWDDAFRAVQKKHPDGVWLAWGDDAVCRGDHCLFPVVGPGWTKTLGYFGCPPDAGFRFYYNDTWLHDIAKRIGRAIYLPDVHVFHHQLCGPDPRLRKEQINHDKERWTATGSVREDHAGALTAAMRVTA